MLVVAEPEQLPVPEARAGEPAAWDVLFHRYQLPLYVYVFELVHDEQAALDIVQETFINAVRHIGSLRDDRKFGSWLFGIAHQKCVQRWRKQSREETALEELAAVPADLDADPADLLIRQKARALIPQRGGRAPPSAASASFSSPREPLARTWLSALRSLRWHLAGLAAAWLAIALLNRDHTLATTASIAQGKIPSPRQL